MNNRFSIDSDGALTFFSIAPGGRVVWESGTATCTACGCEIHSGKRNDEPEEELLARLGHRRARVKGSILACSNCGREYSVRPEEDPRMRQGAEQAFARDRERRSYPRAKRKRPGVNLSLPREKMPAYHAAAERENVSLSVLVERLLDAHLAR